MLGVTDCGSFGAFPAPGRANAKVSPALQKLAGVFLIGFGLKLAAMGAG